MNEERYTQAHILAGEAFANLATILGKSLQVTAHLLNNPDYKPDEFSFASAAGSAASNPAPAEVEPARSASTDPVKPEPGQIHSNELDEDSLIEQVSCLYNPKVMYQLENIALYDMFRFASAQFNYEMKTDDPAQELSLSDKKKIALAWIVTKRAFVINHYEEVIYVLNLPDMISGNIYYKAPIQVMGLSELDKQDIAASCSLLAEFIDDGTPLDVLIAEALSWIDKEDKAAKLATLPPLSGLPNSAPLNWMIKAIVNTSVAYSPVLSPSGNPAALEYYEKDSKCKKGSEAKYFLSKDTVVVSGKTYYRRTDRYVESSRTNRHRQAAAYRSKDKKVLISEEIGEDGNRYIFKLTNPDRFAKDKTFVKLLFFVLQKWNEQQYADKVGFSLQELVDIKMYSKPANALRAVRSFFEQQANSILSGSLKVGNKTIRAKDGFLFYNLDLNNGFVELSVNREFNFDFIASQFTSFPRAAYSLDNINAFLLVHYIFALARQNTDKIRANGSFNISLRAVQENIGLPSPETVKESMNRRYKQLIIDPIEKAIEDIETWAATVPEAKDFGLTITPVVKDCSGVFEWISGHLVIGLNGEFAQKFIDIAVRNEKARESRARLIARRQAAKEKREE